MARKWQGSGGEVARKWQGSGKEVAGKWQGSGREVAGKWQGSGREVAGKRHGWNADADYAILLILLPRAGIESQRPQNHNPWTSTKGAADS